MTEKIPYLVTNIRQVETLDFRALEKAAGVKFRESHQERILDLISLYLENLYIENEAPADAEIKKRLNKITRLAGDLDELLFDSSYKGKCALFYCWPTGKADPQQIRSFLPALKENSKAAARTISPTPGRRTKLALRNLIGELHFFWRWAGGRGLGSNYDPNTESYAGPFLLFLQLILKQAGHLHKRAALHKVIQSVKSSLSTDPIITVS